MDTDKDGKLEQEDKKPKIPAFPGMPMGMAMRGRSMSRGMMEEAMRAAETEDDGQKATDFIDVDRDDEDGDGEVDFEEFVAGAYQNENLMFPLAFRFDRYYLLNIVLSCHFYSDRDEDGDGTLSLSEFMPPGILQVLASGPDQLKALKDAVLSKIDPNNDGTLDFNEYVKLASSSSGRSAASLPSFELPYEQFLG